jgi:uncharacterized FAD-dependent dehydrogenase
MSHSAVSTLSADVLIVGAGIAGILAAHQVLRERPGSSVLIVDKGLTLDERREQTASRLEGFGGAGLYLGGRLFVGPTTIPVLPPVMPPASMRPVLQGDDYLARAAEVNQFFTELGITAPVRATPEGALAESIARAAGAGLDYLTSYPSRVPTVEERFAVLARIEEMLRADGARFAFTTQAETIERTADGFLAQVAPVSGVASEQTKPATVRARALVLAPGRYGAEWLVRIAGELGAEVASLPGAYGVRIEVPAAAYDPLTNVYPDPRLQRQLPGDAVIKTYATCPGGLVLPATRYGRLVASGAPRFGAQRGPNTTVAILVQPGVVGAAERWRGGEALAEELNADTSGRLLVQRLGDIRTRHPTTAADLAANAVQSSCADALPGSFYDALPAAYWEAFDDFLSRLETLAPGVDASATLVYAPAEERFWHFPTNERLETNVPGLLVAGDATGQTQGVIQAGIAGMLAGEGAARFLASRR